MASPANDSDRTLADARALLARQQAGGRRAKPIGRRSAERRKLHALRKAARIAISLAAIAVATIGAGIILGGIGLTGLFFAVLAAILAVVIFSAWPRLEVPDLGKLNRGDVKTLVGNTELWLERQTPALPPPAIQVVQTIGGQLDTLGVQLQGLDENRPEAVEIRKLFGEQLPGIVSSFTSIPPHLRGEVRAGRSPDQQVTESLGKISAEIDAITRDLASGAIDSLAVRTRYLDYKYGDGLEDSSSKS
jgi:hypothetical protein